MIPHTYVLLALLLVFIIIISFQGYYCDKRKSKPELFAEDVKTGSATNWVQTPKVSNNIDNTQCCKKLDEMIATAEEDAKVREKEQQMAEKQAQIRANEEKAQYEERAQQAEQMAKENQDKFTAMEKKYNDCKAEKDACPGRLAMALDAQTKLQVCCDTQRAEAEKARKDLADIKAEIDKVRGENNVLVGKNNALINQNNNLNNQIKDLNGRIRSLEDQTKAYQQSLEYEKAKSRQTGPY